jgi:AraC-like DNA-binding protein
MTPISLDWLHVAALLGALQGLFLAAVLATQRRNRTANRLLAVAMVGFSVHLTSVVYHAAGLEQRFPHFFGVAYPLLILYGPLIYLYAVTASDRTRGLRWRDGLHFLPFVAVVLLGLPIYLMSGPEKLAFYQELQQGVRPLVMKVVDPLKSVSGISYGVATILLLRRHRARVKDNYSSIERVNLQWLLWLAASAAAIWVLATVFQVTEAVSHPLLERGDDVVALAIAVLVYGIGYMALRQPEIFRFVTVDHGAPHPGHPGEAPSLASAPPPASSIPPAETAAARYERSGLTEQEATALKDALLAVMDKERLYQNSDLTLADLADRLDTTPHKLSEVLNSQLEQTFYDFVNAYRVQDVKRRIADERLRHLKILSLAMDAGFASKSTFNHVFRQHTGRTPSAYRRSLTG